MKIYWRLKSIPELKGLPKDERKRIWRRCSGKALGHWKTQVCFVMVCLGVPASSMAWIVLGNDVLTFCVGLPFAMLLGAAAAHVFIRVTRAYVLIERGRYCTTCGYDLTGNESGVCPECGNEVQAQKKLSPDQGSNQGPNDCG